MNEKANAPRIDLRWLAEDKPRPADVAPASLDSLCVSVGGSNLYGAVMLPDGTYPAPRPCAIMIHGYPGTSRNDDLAQALRRCGVCVAVPHLRGAWGSEGEYSFEHIVEDTAALANEFRDGELGRRMNVDPSAVFLIGHSMGGWASLNAARALPWLRGLVLLAPYDLTYYPQRDDEAALKELLVEGTIMRMPGVEALFAEAYALRDRSFAAAADDVKDLDLAVVCGTADPVAPWAMSEPLWNALGNIPSQAVRRKMIFDDDHSFSAHRIALARFIAQFFADVLK
ncbi:MAG: alpha/beta fold hydrolase [Pyramidobacter sp.]|nr:alpha/beta fold hydrolase [Pyramidobacter sp.]